jgi:hypothetical protein
VGTKLLARLGTAITLAVGGVVLAAPAAYADSRAAIDGARATFTSYGEVFRLYDTRCDSNPVYMVYKVNGGSEHRLDYSGGCGTHATYNLSFSEGARVTYKACVNIRPGFDRCSGWTTDLA